MNEIEIELSDISYGSQKLNRVCCLRDGCDCGFCDGTGSIDSSLNWLVIDIKLFCREFTFTRVDEPAIVELEVLYLYDNSKNAAVISDNFVLGCLDFLNMQTTKFSRWRYKDSRDPFEMLETVCYFSKDDTANLKKILADKVSSLTSGLMNTVFGIGNKKKERVKNMTDLFEQFENDTLLDIGLDKDKSNKKDKTLVDVSRKAIKATMRSLAKENFLNHLKSSSTEQTYIRLTKNDDINGIATTFNKLHDESIYTHLKLLTFVSSNQLDDGNGLKLNGLNDDIINLLVDELDKMVYKKQQLALLKSIIKKHIQDFFNILVKLLETTYIADFHKVVRYLDLEYPANRVFNHLSNKYIETYLNKHSFRLENLGILAESLKAINSILEDRGQPTLYLVHIYKLLSLDTLLISLVIEYDFRSKYISSLADGRQSLYSSRLYRIARVVGAVKVSELNINIVIKRLCELSNTNIRKAYNYLIFLERKVRLKYNTYFSYYDLDMIGISVEYESYKSYLDNINNLIFLKRVDIDRYLSTQQKRINSFSVYSMALVAIKLLLEKQKGKVLDD